PRAPGAWNCAERSAAQMAMLNVTAAEMISLSSDLFMISSLFVPGSQMHDALLIDILTVVVANELDHFVVRHPAICESVRDGFFEHDRIFDRDLIVHNVRRDHAHPFGDVDLIAVRYALVLDGLFDADGIDDERISIPFADGASVVARRHI